VPGSTEHVYGLRRPGYKTLNLFLFLGSWNVFLSLRAFFCCLCFVDIRLTHQLQQEWLQVVCSNKEARKHLARRHSRNICLMFVCIVVCACSRHALDVKILFFISFVITKGVLRDYFTKGYMKTTAWIINVQAEGLWTNNASVLFETQTKHCFLNTARHADGRRSESVPQYLTWNVFNFYFFWVLMIVCLFVEIKPDILYSASCVGREVNPLGVITHGQRYKPRAHQWQQYIPRACQSMVNTPQVDGLTCITSEKYTC